MRFRFHRQLAVGPLVFAFLVVGAGARSQTAAQPKVAPGPDEPDWVEVLELRYGLSLFGDLANPVIESPLTVPGTFRKAGPGPVRYTPEIALGLATRTRGGWYPQPAGEESPSKTELWRYTLKNSRDDVKTGNNLPPPLEEGSRTSFDPGDRPFGIWVANDGFDDGGVYSEPIRVARHNSRLAAQPYKAMIYPYRDPETRQVIPNSYLIGWEYSTNDDFQDVVCRLDNVILIQANSSERPAAGDDPTPDSPGIAKPGPRPR